MEHGPTSITPAIVEALYTEALCLAEDAREALEACGASGWPSSAATPEAAGAAQAALSREALRTTTRMMHALAWLLNHRAFLAGELSEFQLRRHGRLPPGEPASDPAQLALLEPTLAATIAQTSAFYERIKRLDASWQLQGHEIDQPVSRIHERLGRSFAIGGS